MTVHSFARSKMPRQNMTNDVRLSSRVLALGNSMPHTLIDIISLGVDAV